MNCNWNNMVRSLFVFFLVCCLHSLLVFVSVFFFGWRTKDARRLIIFLVFFLSFCFCLCRRFVYINRRYECTNALLWFYSFVCVKMQWYSLVYVLFVFEFKNISAFKSYPIKCGKKFQWNNSHTCIWTANRQVRREKRAVVSFVFFVANVSKSPSKTMTNLLSSI